MFFESDFGRVVYDCSTPSNPNGIVVQIAHGMVEHRARYAWLCQKLAHVGYKVYINDHRGHGDSIGGEVSLGEMGREGFERAVGDMHTVNALIKVENPNAKIVLLGHSMGSLLSRRFLQLHEGCIDALILSGTPSPNPLARLGSSLAFALESIAFNKGLKRLFGKVICHFSLGRFNAKFKQESAQSPSHWICSDKAIVAAYDADPKAQFIFSLRSFGNLFGGLKRVFSRYPHAIKNPHLPVLFVSGVEDACGEFGKGVVRAYKHLISQGYENVSLKLYSACRHEVFNEVHKERYLDDVLTWLKQNNLDSA